MVRRYEFHGEEERCMQFGMEYVPADDYDRLAEQYASYRETAGASIGADLNQQAIERISELEAELARNLAERTRMQSVINRFEEAEFYRKQAASQSDAATESQK